MKEFGILFMLCANIFAADFSASSEETLISLAGKVAPQEYPDYKMEIYKRVQDMKVRDARAFYEKICAAREKAYENMTPQQMREYRDSIHYEMRLRLDSMSFAKQRETGLTPDSFGAFSEKFCDRLTRVKMPKAHKKHIPPHLQGNYERGEPLPPHLRKDEPLPPHLREQEQPPQR